jgi:hypothetical protein
MPDDRVGRKFAVPEHVVAVAVGVGDDKLERRLPFGKDAAHGLRERQTRARQQAVGVLQVAGVEQQRLVHAEQQIHEVALGAVALVLAHDEGIGIEPVHLQQRIGVRLADGRAMNPLHVRERRRHVGLRLRWRLYSGMTFVKGR